MEKENISLVEGEISYDEKFSHPSSILSPSSATITFSNSDFASFVISPGVS